MVGPTPTAGWPDADSDMSWRMWAACRGLDPEWWFPAARDDVTAETAKQVCAGCPVQTTCADWALETRQQYGIFGGIDQETRRALIQKRRREAEERVA